jgi:hypothetical protein
MFVSHLSGCGRDYVRKTKSFQESIISANAGAGNKKTRQIGVPGLRSASEQSASVYQ